MGNGRSAAIYVVQPAPLFRIEPSYVVLMDGIRHSKRVSLATTHDEADFVLLPILQLIQSQRNITALIDHLSSRVVVAMDFHDMPGLTFKSNGGSTVVVDHEAIRFYFKRSRVDRRQRVFHPYSVSFEVLPLHYPVKYELAVELLKNFVDYRDRTIDVTCLFE